MPWQRLSCALSSVLLSTPSANLHPLIRNPSLPCLGSPPPVTSLFPGSLQRLSNQFSWFWSLLLVHPHLSRECALPNTKSNPVLCLKPSPVSELGIRYRPGRQAGDNQTCACHIPPSSTYPYPYSRPVEFLPFYCRHLCCCCLHYSAPLYVISPATGLPLLPGKLLFLHLLRSLDTLRTLFPMICHVMLLIWLPSWSINSSLLRAISASSMVYRIRLINSVHTRKRRVKWIYK